jgi:hypothetical protein
MAQANDLTPPIDAVVEKENVVFDYGQMMAAGATITSVVSITCAVYFAPSGITDPSPASRIIGGSSIVASPKTGAASQAVIQLVGTMVGGITYRLQCVVNTSDGQELSIWDHFPCQTPN